MVSKLGQLKGDLGRKSTPNFELFTPAVTIKGGMGKTSFGGVRSVS